MIDVLTKEQRRYNMSQIRNKDTKPEILLRKLIFSLGYRYRLYDPNLPGKPDLVFSRRKKVIFLHGCFWHSHDCKYGSVKPTSNSDFWSKKRNDTILRDRKNIDALNTLGWQVLVIWECMLSDINNTKEVVVKFLEK